MQRAPSKQEILSSKDFVDLRDDIFVIHDPGDHITRFDLEGRWFFASREDKSYRRCMDGRVREQSRVSRKGTGSRNLRWLTESEVDDLTQSIAHHATESQSRIGKGKGMLKEILPEDLGDIFDRISSWDSARFKEFGADFARIYGSIPVLPSDQYFSLYLQLVKGCHYNLCTFCTLYRDQPFEVRSADDWVEHLEDVKRFFGRGISVRRNIFIGDANGLAIDQSELISRLRAMREVFPISTDRGGLSEITAFVDTFSGTERGVEEYKELKEFGLKRLYVGVETGLDSLRELIKKPGSHDHVLDRITRIKASGLNVGIMIMTGLGGKKLSTVHVVETLRLLNDSPLDRKDLVFLSPLSISSNSEYAKLMKQNDLEPLDADGIENEDRLFRTGIPPEPKAATYDIEGFVY